MNENNSSFNYKCVIHLKQETPMLHFRCDEYGATVRATELKPKLDRYIKKVCTVEKDWFIKDTNALNYKVRIKAIGAPKISDNREQACSSLDREGKIKNGRGINGMYFANMVTKGDNKEDVKKKIYETYKETVFYENGIEMTVICFVKGLMDAIKENIQAFFILHNFGTRQSKGFGGFTVTKIDDNICICDERIIKTVLEKYKYFYAQCPNAGSADCMNHAYTVYSVLKGGLNMTGWRNDTQRYTSPKNYIKSYVQRPFLDALYTQNKMGSEKAKIKSKKPLPQNAVLTSERERNDNKDKTYKGGYVFIRAMLGLADHYEFRNLRVGTVNVYSLGEEDFDVERFKSPITIKIIGQYIFFIFDMESIEIMKNRTFYLLDNPAKIIKANDSYSKKKETIISKGWKIETPKEFGAEEIDRLIKGFVEYFNNEKEKLQSFRPPFQASAGLKLNEGGKIQ